MSTRIKTIDEFYKAVDNLIERLKLIGSLGDASILNRLMHETIWTTGSELIGDLQLELKGMKGKFPKDVDEEINECYVFALQHRNILGLSG